MKVITAPASPFGRKVRVAIAELGLGDKVQVEIFPVTELAGRAAPVNPLGKIPVLIHDDGATLYDVTHLGCRSARYTPATANNSCSPADARTTGYPILPGATMPDVKGCRKQDYAVLIVVGLPTTR